MHSYEPAYVAEIHDLIYLLHPCLQFSWLDTLREIQQLPEAGA